MKRSPTPKRANASVTKASIVIDVEGMVRGKVGVETERRRVQPATYQRRGKVGETVIRVPTSKCRRHAFTVPSNGVGFRAEERVKRKRNRHPDPGGDVEVENIGWKGGRIAGMLRGDGDLQRTLAAPSSFEDPVVPTAVNHWPLARRAGSIKDGKEPLQMQLACSVSTNVGRQAKHPTFSPSCRNSFLFMAYKRHMWLRTRRRKGSRLASKIFFAAVLVQSWRMGAEVRRMCHWWTIMT